MPRFLVCPWILLWHLVLVLQPVPHAWITCNSFKDCQQVSTAISQSLLGLRNICYGLKKNMFLVFCVLTKGCGTQQLAVIATVTCDICMLVLVLWVSPYTREEGYDQLCITSLFWRVNSGQVVWGVISNLMLIVVHFSGWTVRCAPYNAISYACSTVSMHAWH